MLACVDVDYRPDREAVAACVLFEGWSVARPSATRLARVNHVADYIPGEFYRRELPCLLAVLEPVIAEAAIETILVDGFVWLDERCEQPGLGAHLHRALGGTIPVVGVAKTSFKTSRGARLVHRGESARPLFVSAAGLDPDLAADRVRTMHGAHRVPTLLRLVDRLCRDG